MNKSAQRFSLSFQKYQRRIILLIKAMVFAATLPSLVAAGEAVPLNVAVSILPQEYFVKKIGGDLVSVMVMVPPGASPATYEPKPSQMVAITGSSLYFSIGVPFEETWLPKISSANPFMKEIHTDAGIDKLPMAAHSHDTADTETAKDDAGVPDPHIWLSPPLVKLQAKRILTALQDKDPVHRDVYERNSRQFAEEIDTLDTDLRRLFLNLENRRFMVFHPSWGYFAKAYGLEQIPIESEGKDPKPAQLQSLIKTARADGVRIVFVQPQFSTRNAETIAKAIDGAVLTADPLAANWEENLRRQAVKIRDALR